MCGVSMDRFYADDIAVRDSYGRERIFKGINICFKEKNLSAFKFRHFVTRKKLMKNMLEAGVNIVRLGITWSALEPNEGKYNDNLIREIKIFANSCADNGIYILLDMHQDLFSSKFYGDGAPEWVIDKSLSCKRPYAIWAEGYFYMDAVQKSFEKFWNNENEIQNKFINAWRYFSSEFSDCENIIGLDYLNEPYVDKNGRKIFLSIISKVCEITFCKKIDFEKYFKSKNEKSDFARMCLKIASIIKSKKRLEWLFKYMDSYENFARAVDGLEKYTNGFNKSYYQKFYDRIRKEAGLKNSFDFFEHNYYSNLGIPFEIETEEKSIYSPHAYDVFIDSPLYNSHSSNERISFILDSIRKNQEKMRVPVIFGEWGGGAPNGNKWISHIEYIMEIFEKYHWSSIYWGYDFTNKKLNEVFNRPYPYAVCGNIKLIKTDCENRLFTLEWEQGKEFEETNAETEIFVPGKPVYKIKGKTGFNRIKIEY